MESVSKKIYLPIKSAKDRAMVDFPVPIMPTKKTFVPWKQRRARVSSWSVWMITVVGVTGVCGGGNFPVFVMPMEENVRSLDKEANARVSCGWVGGWAGERGGEGGGMGVVLV